VGQWQEGDGSKMADSSTRGHQTGNSKKADNDPSSPFSFAAVLLLSIAYLRTNKYNQQKILINYAT
jgi:hypothetical protein